MQVLPRGRLYFVEQQPLFVAFWIDKVFAIILDLQYECSDVKLRESYEQVLR